MMRRMGFFIELTEKLNSYEKEKIWININNIASIKEGTSPYEHEDHRRVQLKYINKPSSSADEFLESKAVVEEAIRQIFHEEQDKIEKLNRFDILDILDI